ncbi:Sialic acid TRAP transporter permease protein SiaT [subsurface metagenome]
MTSEVDGGRVLLPKGNLLFEGARWLAWGVDKACSIAGLLAGILVLSQGFLVFYEVIMRYVVNRPTLWSQEIIIYCGVIYVPLAAAWAMKEGAHLRVSVITSRLLPKTRTWLGIFTEGLGLVYAAIFTYFAFNFLMISLGRAELGQYILHIPIWPLKMFFFIGLFLLTAQGVRRFVANLYSACHLELKGSSESRGRPALAIGVFLVLLAVGIWVYFQIPLIGLFFILLILLMFGLPVAFGLGLTGVIGIILLARGASLVSICSLSYGMLNSFALLALPLFLCSGFILGKTGLANDLFNAVSAFLGHLPGGVGIATIGAMTVFGAMSGSGVAAAATIGVVALPALLKRGYNIRTAAGLVAAGGVLAFLIPPSPSPIICGVLAEESIAKLFVAGIVPGLITAAILSLTLVLLCRGGHREARVPWRDRPAVLRKSAVALGIPVIIMGGIYGGVCTPTEAAAITVVYVLLAATITGKLRLAKWGTTARGSVRTVGMVYMIIFGAMSIAFTVNMLRVPLQVVQLVTIYQVPNWLFMVLIQAFRLFLGMFLDGASIGWIMNPMLIPIVKSLGIPIAWYMVLGILNGGIGSMTPPVAMTIYIVCDILKLDFVEAVKGAIPFIAALLIAMTIVFLVPQLSLWLPYTVMK